MRAVAGVVECRVARIDVDVNRRRHHHRRATSADDATYIHTHTHTQPYMYREYVSSVRVYGICAVDSILDFPTPSTRRVWLSLYGNSRAWRPECRFFLCDKP